MSIRSLALTGAFMFSATALAACGSDSSGSRSTTSDSAEKKSTAAAPAATASLDTVLACLTAAGLDAKDQTNSTGDVIGIDYPGGRTVISFQPTASEADAMEIAMGTDALRAGNIVASIADDSAAEADKAAIQTCLA